MKVTRAIIAILIAALGSVIGITINSLHAQPSQPWSVPTEETYRYLNLFGTVMDKIRKSHIEENKDKDLIESAIRGMMKSLDGYSNYMDAKQFKRMSEQTSGSFFGIGAEVSYEKDKFDCAIKFMPMEGSPAKDAGLKNGDLAVEIDGTKVSTLDLMQGVDLIKGPKGTTVKLKIIREGVEKPFDIIITRDKIKIQVVRSRVIKEKIMYVKLSTFNLNSARDIRKAILTMNPAFKCLAIGVCPESNYKGLILDMRNNHGGLLNQAVRISDLFLDEGIIVYTKTRGGIIESQNFANTGQIIPRTMPIVILVNQSSASASEIVAGALKDLKRATIIGVKTFGKGSVQSIIPLENGGALRLTIAKYYTASGVTIHKVGITPDIIVELKKDPTDETKNEKMKRGYDDTQIMRAVKFLLSGN